MKKILVAFLATLLVSRAFAQGLSDITVVDSNYQAQSLFSLNYVAGGFDVDSSGDIFYLGGNTGDPYESDQLLEATPASNYLNDSIAVVDLPSPQFPSFVTVHGSTVYYGYTDPSSFTGAGTLASASTTPVTPTPGPNVIISTPDIDDLAFSSSGSTPYVSANINGAATFAPENGVYALISGNYEEVLQTDDFSGPIALTSTGGLIYGASGANGFGGIYTFSAAAVQAALTTGTPLQLSQGALLVSNTGNGSFALVGNELYDVYSPAPDVTTAASSVTAYNLTTGASTLIATATNGFEFTGISGFDGSLFVGLTDYDSSTYFIDLTPVPEPGAAPLGMAGLLMAGAFEWNRSRHRQRASAGASTSPPRV